ncbi:partial N-acetylglucosaminyl-diphospho-decaprenol L-rhamnosyltransferase, partial [Anaerolineae bacterium]
MSTQNENVPRDNLLSVIIPIWRGRAYIPACLESVTQQANVRVEIIAVDNASGDGAAEWIGEQYPHVHVIRNPVNLGFAGACNLGMRAAHGDLLLLLNQDTRMKPGCLLGIQQAFDNPDVGVVGCKIFYPDSQIIQHAGGRVDWPLGLTHHWGYREPDAEVWNVAKTVDYVTGAALAFRRDILTRVGMLDEGFWPGYFEDVDFCLRVRKAGYQVLYEPRA